jgi:hypothetical protein
VIPLTEAELRGMQYRNFERGDTSNLALCWPSVSFERFAVGLERNCFSLTFKESEFLGSSIISTFDFWRTFGEHLMLNFAWLAVLRFSALWQIWDYLKNVL